MRYLLRHHGRPSAVADWESRPYRHPKQQGDERHEYEAEVIADGQELQVIELLGGEPDGAADWSIEHLPGEVAQPDGEPRGRGLARRRHRDILARIKQRAEDAADRLGEAAGGVLRGRALIRKAAVPGRTTAHRVRGKAVDDLYCGERRYGEDENQEPVIGAAALGDRD